MHAMLREKKPLAMAIEEINHFLNNRYRGTELITLFAGIYNNSTRELTYINAGHCAPLLINHGKRQHYQLEGVQKSSVPTGRGLLSLQDHAQQKRRARALHRRRDRNLR
jgi:serine phosphatase RsbU (regulator of sigma subunit)